MKKDTIICATIGSESCKRAEDRAIALAKEKNSELIFLYVIDTSFLNGIAREIHGTEVLDKGLERIGTIILENAKNKASEMGVEAKIEIRTGNVLEEIKKAIIEHNAKTLVIGNEKRDKINQYLTGMRVIDFVDDIKSSTGAEVLVVD